MSITVTDSYVLSLIVHISNSYVVNTDRPCVDRREPGVAYSVNNNDSSTHAARSPSPYPMMPAAAAVTAIILIVRAVGLQFTGATVQL